MDLAQRLGRQELVVVTGKGGVGKTTLSLALGSLLAEHGRRVVVLETDPRESLHQLADTAPSGGEIVRAGPRLWIQNVQPRSVLEELVHERVRIAALARRIVASPIFENFAAGAPGLKELAVLVHARRLASGRRRRGDVVVLDAPATGHGVSLLAAPQLVTEVIAQGPVGEMAQELAALIADAERCAVVIVTLAEEMAVQEAIELIALLRQRVARRADLVAVNGLYPPLPDPPPAAPPGAAGAMELWAARRAANERELARLGAAWKGTRVELPLVPIERGPALVAALRSLLAGKSA